MTAPETFDWATFQPKDRATLLFIVEPDFEGPEGRGRILLIRKKRGLGAGKINGPGGRLEPGETAWACAVRETEEEVGVTPSGLRKLGELSFQFLDGYSLFAHVFRADAFQGTLIETDEAVPLWFPLRSLPFDEMWADDRLWLPHVLSSASFEGFFVFDDERMVSHTVRIRGPWPTE